MMDHKPYSITIGQLDENGKENIPKDLLSSTQMIYSSPATLAFNSPGAEGFGVKRAGLAIPGSVMLLVGPGCCGRNTTLLNRVKGYEDRFFFLLMDEADIVSGRHLKRIPQAVCEVVESLKERPSVVMICSTCVDALLGTDWDRVCKKAQEAAGLPVKPAYMYALTREGRKPPMTLVRKSVYSLLEKQKRNSRTVNLMGYFAPLRDDSELYDLLEQLGIRKVNEISRCKDYEAYLEMSKANFNLVLNPEARYAADDLASRLEIPYMELARLYQADKIANQYRAFAGALGAELDFAAYEQELEETVSAFTAKYPALRVSVGEMLNGNSFEMALALTKYGIRVEEIYANITADDYVYIRHLAKLSPETKVYTNLNPTMLYYDCSQMDVDLTIGKDAIYYHPDAASVKWNEDVQPFGFRGVKALFDEMDAALTERSTDERTA